MKINRRPLLAIIPAAALAGTMLTAPVAGAQSSLPTDAFGSFTGSLGSTEEETPGECAPETEVVTPESAADAGWSTPDDETAAEFKSLEAGSDTDAPAGPGGLFFDDWNQDPPAGEKPKPGTSLYKAVDKPLAELVDGEGNLTPIGFDYFSDATAPALQLRITGANYYEFKEGEEKPSGEGGHWDTGFATIVLSPENSDKSWKTLTPQQVSESAEFWVTTSIAGEDEDSIDDALLRGEKTTLKEIIAMNPDAKLDHVGVQKTRENSTPNTYVDNFRFGCEITDFEVTPRADDSDDDDNDVAPAPGPDFGSLALGGGLALAAALAVGGGAFAIQNGMIQLPPELAALLPA